MCFDRLADYVRQAMLWFVTLLNAMCLYFTTVISVLCFFNIGRLIDSSYSLYYLFTYVCMTFCDRLAANVKNDEVVCDTAKALSLYFTYVILMLCCKMLYLWVCVAYPDRLADCVKRAMKWFVMLFYVLGTAAFLVFAMAADNIITPSTGNTAPTSSSPHPQVILSLPYHHPIHR